MSKLKGCIVTGEISSISKRGFLTKDLSCILQITQLVAGTDLANTLTVLEVERKRQGWLRHTSSQSQFDERELLYQTHMDLITLALTRIGRKCFSYAIGKWTQLPVNLT